MDFQPSEEGATPAEGYPEAHTAQEALVPATEGERILTFQKPPVRFSHGPISPEQAQVKRVFVDAAWSVLCDGAPQYRGARYVPSLNPALFSCLVDLGPGAFSVIEQVRKEVLCLAEKNDFNLGTLRHVTTLLGFMMTDVHSRVDYVFTEEIRRNLENGIPVDGVTLEPVRYMDDEDEARTLATHTTRLTDASGKDKDNVFPLRKMA